MGIALAFMALHIWRQPIPMSLCGCEFDTAMHRAAMASWLSAGVAAIIALVSGVLLCCRHRLGTPVLAVWLITLAGIPWINHFFSPIADPVNPFVVIWSSVLGSLGAALIANYIRRTIRSRDSAAA
jgi:hypothetical protein